VATTPDLLTLKRHRDLKGRRGPWARRTILSVIALCSVLGLANVFGQRPDTAVARTSRADLSLYSPSHLRGGLLFSSRFHINAHSELKKATLVLDTGWLEGMSVNTIEPSPLGEASSNGRITLDLGHIPAGSSYILWIQEQVNATNVAWQRPATVELDDGSTVIARIHHTFTIYP
jgi:hypothetical protein